MQKNILAILAPIALVGLIVGANFGQHKVIEYGISVDAQRKAVHWASFISGEIPNMERLLQTGVPDAQQAARIEDIANFGDVFRFKLFDKDGRNILISDELAKSLEPGALGDHNDSASTVMRTGESSVSLNDGTAKANRPPLYAEAYVPVRSEQGELLGVAEVYLDQSAMSATFSAATRTLSIVLSLAFSVTLSLLYGAFLLKKRQERKSRRKVDYLAKYDQLSGLYNRGGFTRKIGKMQEKGSLSRDHTAVIFLDIDHFKYINDTNGHKAGDAFLRHVGAAISACLTENDIAGRLGGDEFVVVAQRDDVEAACALAQELQDLVSQPMHIDGTMIMGHLSLGIHYGDLEGGTFEEKMHRADLALYQAKMDGRNTYRVFTPELELKVKRRRKVEAAVLGGLDNGLFNLHFQPLLHQHTKACVGFEALLRLTDMDGESIPPDEFIPIAESIGTIKQLGAWVLEQAVDSAKNWPEHMFVSVNLSARQFDGEELVGIVERVIEKSGLSANRLELEVTESLLMDNTESVAGQLAALRAMGISVAMDDFGTGYSSLGYLWRYGFDKLKIDRSFILGLDEDDSRAREILDTIILLGHRLNMVVTAEGIETKSQADILSDLSCDQFQGYFYGKPMPASDLPGYMLRSVSADSGTKHQKAIASTG